MRFFSNEREIHSRHFNTDINNIRANKNQLEGLDADYVVVMPPFFLMSIDLADVVNEHIKSNADVTVVYTRAKKADKDYANCDEMIFNENGSVEKIVPFSGNKKQADISLEIFVYKRKVFENIVHEGKNISALYNLRQVVSFMANRGLIKVNAYKFDGYVAPILSLDHYTRYSFELLDYSVRRKLFKEDWPIYTTTHNTPPALYGPNADVQNSFVANGSIIKGKVRNSIISRDVIVQEGAVVENSILFTSSEVGEDVRINYVLADKGSHICEKKRVVGEEDDILCIESGERI